MLVNAIDYRISNLHFAIKILQLIKIFERAIDVHFFNKDNRNLLR